MAALSKWVPIGGASDSLETNKKPAKQTTIDKIGGIYCHICHSIFGNKKEYDTHYIEHGMGSAAIIYTCVVCRKEIVGYPSFRGHCYLQHVTKDKFKCEHCDKVFSKHCILNTHIQSMHQHKCLTCNNEFKNQKELSLHQIMHKNNQGPPYDCTTCGQQIESAGDCEHHIEDHCNMTYACPICEETIPQIKNAASHLTKHFGDVLTKQTQDDDEDEYTEIKNDSSIDLLGGIFCCLCDQNYKARPEFDNHYMIEHVDKPIVYACNICGKEFDKYHIFANHCYDHYAKGRFQCEVCFKGFPRLSLLVTHVEMYHPEKGDRDGDFPFTCYECDHGFKTQRRLKDHQRNVHNITYHQCPVKTCKKIFSTPKELSSHLKEHASTDLFCRTCGLRFSSAWSCERHIHVHRKKAYRCPICDRGYGEKYLVIKHVNQHFSSVLHICKICGKVYNARSRLNHHMKVHNEEKDHKCTYCGKGFTKSYLLKQHVNIHTGLRPYTCTVCSKSFASHPNLTKHMRCMHNITKIDIKDVYKPNRAPKIPIQNPKTQIEMITKIVDEHNIPNEESNDALNNNNAQNDPATNIVIDNSELMYEAPSFDDSDESGWKADIEPSVLEMLGSIDSIDASADDITELENALWVQTPSSPTASACSVPREYGPEFVDEPGAGGASGSCVVLDDAFLPHIDPLLTLRAPPAALYPRDPRDPRDPPWDPPVYTKLYPDCQYADLQDARYSIINTDIF